MKKTCLKIWANGCVILLPFIGYAGQFTNEFNVSGIPVGTSILGNAGRFSSGGYTNSGGLRLTSTTANQTGSWLINDLDTNKAVVSFSAAFKAQVSGGSGGEGFSFNLANNFPGTAFGEAGGGTGLSVCFDSNDNGDGFTVPGIRVLVGGSMIAQASTPIRNASGAFSNVLVKLDPDGTLDVGYGNALVFNNLAVSLPSMPGAKWGFGGRTSTKTDTNMLDNVAIRSRSAAGPYVESATPMGVASRPDFTAQFLIKDFTTTVVTNTIRLTLDGATVIPAISSDGAGNTTVTYLHGSLLSATAHSYDLFYADNSTPPVTNIFRHVVDVQSFRTLPTNYIVSPSIVDTNTAGFEIRAHQVGANQGISVSRAEKQFADELIDPGTGQPYPNLADLSTFNPDGTFDELTTLNYTATGDTGNFPGDRGLPGMPGGNGTIHYALEAITYLELTPGFYTFGVNSDDGFRLTSAVNPRDVFATEISVYDGSRLSPADTSGGIVVQEAGLYPFRVLYFQGTGNGGLEFFTIDADGVKTLINSGELGAIKAYREASVTRPYLRSASPKPNETSVPNNTSITLKLVDGTILVDTNTIQLALDGTNVTAEISQVSGVTTLTYTPPVNFGPASTHTVKLVYTDSTSVITTNQYSFVTAQNLSLLWSIQAGSSPYVSISARPAERGIAYNPATDHVLVPHFNDSGTPLAIAIFNASNGVFLGTMDVNGVDTPTATFAILMLDVTDDGVIYAANLANWTSSDIPLKVYRWENESASLTKAYDGRPMAGYGYTVRYGDTMRVRRSGAGTQILFGGNQMDATGPFSTNAVLLTTTDGVNFTPNVLTVSGINPGDLRLGLAWGCGDTFFGSQTVADGSTTVRHVAFDLGTGLATAINSYVLRVPPISGDSAATIGPIGVDHASQRLLANATASGDPIGFPFNGPGHPHSMNLYDLATIAPLPEENYAVDQKAFLSQNGSFGTGSIDFTPNGDRVFTLDSNNGIMAFSMSPTATQPGICTPPSSTTNRVGTTAFFGVEATGTPLNYQWRLNGNGISGATTKNINIPNVQVADAGTYTVNIHNTVGFVLTPAVELHVSATIMTQPADQAVNQGETGNLSVVADGEAPLSYQWRRDGTNLVGKTAATLTIPNAQVADGAIYSVVVSNPYGTETSANVFFNVLIGSTPGTGIGLLGDYFADTNLTDPAVLSRLDAAIDFDWGTDSPDPSVPVDDFSVRWTGFIEPLYSQTYRFYTRTDDGVRLLVNNQLLIDKWVNQGPTEWTGSIALTANERYPITMEYYERGSGATAQLKWWSASQVKGIIPVSQLYTNTSVVVTPGALSASRNANDVTINWTGTFHLQSSTNVAGPFLNLGVSNAPFTTNIISAPSLFFRLSN